MQRLPSLIYIYFPGSIETPFNYSCGFFLGPFLSILHTVAKSDFLNYHPDCIFSCENPSVFLILIKKISCYLVECKNPFRNLSLGHPCWSHHLPAHPTSLAYLAPGILGSVCVLPIHHNVLHLSDFVHVVPTAWNNLWMNSNASRNVFVPISETKFSFWWITWIAPTVFPQAVLQV